MLKDATISGDGNMIKKEAEKILKYKYLTIEVQCMWKVKTMVIPVIEVASGTILESFRKYLNNILGKHDNQGTAENSHTLHRLQKVCCKSTEHST